MPSCWVLVVLGGACALPAPAPFTYTQALAQAIDSFNQRPEVQNVFRMLSADPEPTPVIKECTGPVLFLQSSPEIDLRCTDASSNPVLVQRGRFGRFLSRIRHIRPRISIDIQARGSIRFG
ncbi:CTHL2 protein, partial [Spizaetus tyrannus]|nr:CTHL2 protein [Spizaetus tyrannus]